jgi:hypothetical protein
MHTQVPSLTGSENRPDDARLDINLPGEKELPGIWIDQTEGGEVLAAGGDRVREPRRLPQRRGVAETVLPGTPAYQQKIDQDNCA